MCSKLRGTNWIARKNIKINLHVKLDGIFILTVNRRLHRMLNREMCEREREREKWGQKPRNRKVAMGKAREKLKDFYKFAKQKYWKKYIVQINIAVKFRLVFDKLLKCWLYKKNSNYIVSRCIGWCYAETHAHSTSFTKN